MGTKEVGIAGKKLVIYEHGNVYDSVTGQVLTGSWVWNSSLVLSEWMVTQSQHGSFDFHNKIVLELGAGTGLPGLTAAELGAARVILTDVEPLLPGLKMNIEANNLEDRVDVCKLVWGSDELSSRIGELGLVDLVVMSDVFFDEEAMAALVKTLRKVCGKGTRVWAASELRPWTGECLNELEREGFRVIELPSQLGPGFACGKEEDVFAIFELVPPDEEDEILEQWSPILS